MRLKIATVLSIVLIPLLLFTGCGSKTTAGNKEKSDKLVIATSFYPMYIFTQNITMDVPGVKVVNMTKPTTGCLHDYSITTEDMKKLHEAGILVVNGAGMESFMDKVIDQQPDLKIIDAGESIKLIKGDNPHLWVSISNAIKQVRNIGTKLAELDPDNADKYRKNMEAYIKKLEAERVKMHNVLDGIKNRNIITFHEAFPYFAKEFNLNIAGVVEREPNSEPSARELSDTIKMIKKLKVKAIFAEPQYSSKAADTIANETGTKVYTLDPVVTGPMKPEAYIEIMDNNLKILKEALK